MGRISGITVRLYERTELKRDEANEPVWWEVPVDVDNVLVAPSTDTEIVDAERLYGKKAVYTLALPKGDAHEWEHCRVDFFGHSWRVIGFGTEGIEANIPLSWNKKIMVERYG